jgi:dihydrodipicolinate synthase/N-acetylneuraminate lyase
MSPRPLSPSDFARSVVAVPPIALDAEGRVAAETNRRLMAHIAGGGITTLLYGGNANLYHYGATLFREALETLHADCPDSARILFSIGPDFGKSMDQVAEIRQAGVVDVMLLPTAFPSDPRGVAEGARRIADALGFGVVLYLKRDGYVDPEALGRLVEDGTVGFVKYAVEREDATTDAYLDAVLAAVGVDKVASGMGETPIDDHLGHRGLATYTSGAVCIAPAAANELLALYRAGQAAEARRLGAPFLEFERLRMKLGGIAVLHDAVGLAGLGDCGPLSPMLSNLTEAGKAEIAPVVAELRAAEAAASGRRLAA